MADLRKFDVYFAGLPSVSHLVITVYAPDPEAAARTATYHRPETGRMIGVVENAPTSLGVETAVHTYGQPA